MRRNRKMGSVIWGNVGKLVQKLKTLRWIWMLKCDFLIVELAPVQMYKLET